MSDHTEPTPTWVELSDEAREVLEQQARQMVSEVISRLDTAYQTGLRNGVAHSELRAREALQSTTQALTKAHLTIERLEQEVRRLREQLSRNGFPDLSLDALELSERPQNVLRRAGVHTIDALIQWSPDDLLGLTNFGQKSLDEVIHKLGERGYSLRQSATPNNGVSELFALSVKSLGITPRIVKILARCQVFSIGQLIELSESDLLEMNLFGRGSLQEVKEALRKRGLSVRTEDQLRG